MNRRLVSFEAFSTPEQRNVKQMMREMDCFVTALLDQLQIFRTITSLILSDELSTGVFRGFLDPGTTKCEADDV
jgi:hypothetical protein